jgi:thioredoxin reductase
VGVNTGQAPANRETPQRVLALGRALKSETVLSGGLLAAEDVQKLRGTGVRVKLGKVVKLEGAGGWLSAIGFEDGSDLPASALFFVPLPRQRSGLAKSLGCRMSPSGQIECGPNQETSVAGVFAMGNAAEGLQLVIIAAAEGTKAAFDIDEALRRAMARD